MFSAENEWIAQLAIETTPAEPFSLTSNRSAHDLGFEGAPVFFLDQSPSPDDAWEVGSADGGRPISVALTMGTDGDVAALIDWLPSEYRETAVALVSHLPSGSYWLLRSHLDVAPPGEVLLGNEWVEGGSSIRELMKTEAFYSVVVGAEKHQSPDTNQPLLGVVILNYDGTENRQGALFFPCLESNSQPTHERLLFLPRSGALILDALEAFSAADSQRCRDRWTDAESENFARELAHSQQDEDKGPDTQQ